MINLKSIKNILFIAFILIGFSLSGNTAFAANKFWVGGGSSSNWSATGNTNWSLTSGGANNAAVPTGTDVAIFDSSSGTGTPVFNSGAVTPASITFTNYGGNFTLSRSLIKPVTFNGFTGTYTQGASMTAATTFTNFSGTYTQNSGLATTPIDWSGFSGIFNQNGRMTVTTLDFTGFTGTFNQNNTIVLTGTSGILKFVPTMTYTFTSADTVFLDLDNTLNFTTGGKTMPGIVIRTSSNNDIISLQDDLTSSSYIQIENKGIFNTNDHNVSSVATGMINTGDPSSIATMNLGSTTWTITGSDDDLGDVLDWDIDGVNLILNPGTSTIKFANNSSGQKTFANHAGNNTTYNNLWLTGTGSFYIEGNESTGSLTFNDFTVDTPPHTIVFDSPNPFTFSSFNVSGTEGKLITLISNYNPDDPNCTFMLSKASGEVHSDYLYIVRSVATGGAKWYAGANSVDGGGNTGWIFAPTLTIQSASSINTTTATLNGNVTDTGGENPTTIGFNYGLDTNYGTTTTSTGSFSAGAYTADISGLTCASTYHVRAYATNGSGTHYSSDTTFSTSSCPVTSHNGHPPFPPVAIALPIVVTPTPTIITNPTATPNTISTPTQTEPTITRTLRITYKGDDVRSLQLYLNTYNYSTLIMDGIFGNKTKQAIITIQKANNLIPDGVVGPKTREIINRG